MTAGDIDQSAPVSEITTAVPADNLRTESTPAPSPAPAYATTAPFATAGGIPMPTAAPFPKSAPMSVPSFVKLFKLCISATIVLGGSYFAVKQAYPVLMELAHPGSSHLKGNDAPVGVKLIQRTRGVVDKNNANVDRLNAIINDEFPVETVALPSLPKAPPKMKLLPKPVAPVARIDMKALKNSVNDLTINGVVTGKEPRIIVDGLMVGVGSVVEPKSGLKFMGLDEENRTVFLAGDKDTLFKKKY